MTHTHNVAAFYQEKRDIFERAMKRHLSGLAEWETPEAGMFFWCAKSLPLSPHGAMGAGEHPNSVLTNSPPHLAGSSSSQAAERAQTPAAAIRRR
jgi:hypothetical protein